MDTTATQEKVETAFERIERQVRDGWDRERLAGDLEKRRREVCKKLDRGLEGKGWALFVSGQAYAMENGKAPGRRNAEITLVQEISKWTAEVNDAAPDRMADLVRIVRHGLDNPVKLAGRD